MVTKKTKGRAITLRDVLHHIQAMKGEVLMKIGGLEKRMDGLEKRMDGLGRRMGGLEERMEWVEKKLKAHVLGRN